MENKKLPIVIKKKNMVMVGVSILEIVLGIVFGIIGGGIKSVALWVFVFTGVVTALSVLVEYSEDISLNENKMEFYKNKDLIKAIKYSSIKSIYIGKGNENKTRKKDFFTIGFNDNGNKSKNSKIEEHLINLMSYSSQDLNTIKNVIISKNTFVKVSDDVDKFIK